MPETTTTQLFNFSKNLFERFVGFSKDLAESAIESRNIFAGNRMLFLIFRISRGDSEGEEDSQTEEIQKERKIRKRRRFTRRGDSGGFIASLQRFTDTGLKSDFVVIILDVECGSSLQPLDRPKIQNVCLECRFEELRGINSSWRIIRSVKSIHWTLVFGTSDLEVRNSNFGS